MRYICFSLLPTLLFSLLLCAPSQAIEINKIHTGDIDCSVIVMSQDTEQSDVTVNYDGSECGDLRDINIKFVWMNSVEFSLLYNNIHSPSFEKLFGENPKLLQNVVFKRISELYNKHSTNLFRNDSLTLFQDARISSLPSKNGSHTDSDSIINSSALGVVYARKLNLNLYQQRKFKYISSNEPLIWVSPSFDKNFSNSLFPNEFSYHYIRSAESKYRSDAALVRAIKIGARKKWAQLPDDIFSCLNYSRFITKRDFSQYWDMIESISDQFDDVSTSWKFDIDPDFAFPQAVSNPAYDFYEELLEFDWPEDFIVLSGNFENGSRRSEFDECEGLDRIGGMDQAAYLRDLYVKVAVITPKSKQVSLEKLNFDEDNEKKIRKKPDFRSSNSMDLGDIVLQRDRGDSLVVPLSTQLQYSEEFLNYANRSIWPELEPIFKTYANHKITLARCYAEFEFSTDTDSTSASPKCKSLGAFRLGDLPTGSEPPDITRSYYFGSAHMLKSVTVSGEDVKLREAPEFSIYSEAGLPVGSCPFLYFVSEDGQKSMYGRILIGAIGAGKEKTERFEIMHGAEEIIISEVEPEISTISRITFFDGRGMELAGAPTEGTQITLKPREGVNITVPSGARYVQISGYYELIGR